MTTDRTKVVAAVEMKRGKNIFKFSFKTNVEKRKLMGLLTNVIELIWKKVKGRPVI